MVVIITVTTVAASIMIIFREHNTLCCVVAIVLFWLPFSFYRCCYFCTPFSGDDRHIMGSFWLSSQWTGVNKYHLGIKSAGQIKSKFLVRRRKIANTLLAIVLW